MADVLPSDTGPPEAPSILERIPTWSLAAVLLGLPVALLVACLLAPATFYDRFVWPYLWGPIVADGEGFALGEPMLHNGVPAYPGYNVVNTAVWALVFLAAFASIAKLLHRLRVPMDARLIRGAALWVAAGCLFHVVEDLGAVPAPWRYLLITPLIYILFGLGTILTLGLGKVVAKGSSLRSAAWHRNPQSLVLGVGWILVAASAVWLAALALARPYALMQPLALLAVLLAAALPTGLWLWRRREPNGVVAAWTGGLLSMAILFFEGLDAFTTAVGVDLLGYSEKHVLPRTLVSAVHHGSLGIGWDFGAAYPALVGFVPLKLGVALLVLWLLNITYRREAVQHPSFYGLVRFVLLLDGLGPGLRGNVRLLLGA